MDFMPEVYKKQAEEERFFVHVLDRVHLSGVVRMIQHVREQGSAITRHGRQLRLTTNSMEIGRCTDKEKHEGTALSVRAIIDEGRKVEKKKTHCLKILINVDSNMKVKCTRTLIMRTWVPSCKRPGMMCLVLPWTRRKSDGRGSRRCSTSKTRRFGGGSLDKKLYVKGRWIDVSKGDSTNWKC